jgi:hypothetical protein
LVKSSVKGLESSGSEIERRSRDCHGMRKRFWRGENLCQLLPRLLGLHNHSKQMQGVPTIIWSHKAQVYPSEFALVFLLGAAGIAEHADFSILRPF